MTRRFPEQFVYEPARKDAPEKKTRRPATLQDAARIIDATQTSGPRKKTTNLPPAMEAEAVRTVYDPMSGESARPSDQELATAAKRLVWDPEAAMAISPDPKESREEKKSAPPRRFPEQFEYQPEKKAGARAEKETSDQAAGGKPETSFWEMLPTREDFLPGMSHPEGAPSLEEKWDYARGLFRDRTDLAAGGDVFWEGIKRLPDIIGGSFAAVRQGKDVPAPEDEPGDEYGRLGPIGEYYKKKVPRRIEKSIEQGKAASRGLIEYARKKYGDDYEVFPGITADDLAQFPENLSFSVVAGISGLSAGVPAGVVGGPVAGYGAGTTAAGASAYRMDANRFLRDVVREPLDQYAVSEYGRHMTESEWAQIKKKFNTAATKHGLWEAIPEAVGQAATLGLWKMPVSAFFKTPMVKNRVAKTLSTAGLAYITDLAQEAGMETVTQMGQSGIEAQIGSRKKSDTWGEAFSETFPQVVLLQSIMGPAAGGVHLAARGVSRLGTRGTADADQPMLSDFAPEADFTEDVRSEGEQARQGGFAEFSRRQAGEQPMGDSGAETARGRQAPEAAATDPMAAAEAELHAMVDQTVPAGEVVASGPVDTDTGISRQRAVRDQARQRFFRQMLSDQGAYVGDRRVSVVPADSSGNQFQVAATDPTGETRILTAPLPAPEARAQAMTFFEQAQGQRQKLPRPQDAGEAAPRQAPGRISPRLSEISVEELWNQTPGFLSNAWSEAMAHVEEVEAENQEQVRALEQRLSAMRGQHGKGYNRARKQIREARDNLLAEGESLRGAYEDMVLNGYMAPLIDTAVEQARTMGVAEEDLADFETEFTEAITPDRPQLDNNAHKTFDDLFSQTVAGFLSQPAQAGQEVGNAPGLRADEGQVLPGEEAGLAQAAQPQAGAPQGAPGPEVQGQVQGRPDLEQPAPGQPGAPEPEGLTGFTYEPAGDRRQARKSPPERERRAGQDRRQDTETRKRVAEMSDAEMREALLRDPLTGLGNRRAYDEAEKLAVQASVDVDSLKWVNDNLGHGAGDALLSLMGRAFSGYPEAYHVSGDEFLLQANTREEVDAVIENAYDFLDANDLVYEDPDGNDHILTGSFSYGTGQTLAEAEQALQAHKGARESYGHRAGRGQRPPGYRRGKPGRQDQGAAPEEPQGGQGPVGPRGAVAGAASQAETASASNLDDRTPGKGEAPAKTGEFSPENLLDEWDRQAAAREEADRQSAQKTTAGQKAAETKDHLAAAADKFREINRILGERGSFSTREVDEDLYARIRPLLQEALNEVLAAGQSAAEFVSLAMEHLSTAGRPYFERFVRNDMQTDASGSGGVPAAGFVNDDGTLAVDAVSDYFAAQLADRGYETITQARKEVEDAAGIRIPADSVLSKQLEEAIELGVVKRARQIAARDNTEEAIYNALVELYQRQPTLGKRTSTSMAQQAYSTPAPIAYVASRMAGIDETTRVYDPAAGNGMLLLEAAPERAFVNELNADRAANLERLGFSPVVDDATDVTIPKNNRPEVVIANPPFGKVKNAEGNNTVWRVGDYETTEIDHAISLRALSQMAPDGRAVLIIGGKEGMPETRAKKYQSQAVRRFWSQLLTGYNVTGHYSLSGDLYKRQGAGYPIDIVVIDGYNKSGQPSKKFPGGDVPPVIETFDELGGFLHEQPAIQSRPGVVAQPEPGGPGSVSAETMGSDQESGDVSGTAGRQGAVHARPGGPAGGVRSDADTGGARPSGRPGAAGGRGAAAEPGPADRAPDADGGLASERPRPEPETVSGGPESRSDRDRPGSGQDQTGRMGAERGADESVEETEFQQTYQPQSRLQSMQTQIPKNMADATAQALESLKNRRGPVDQFVARELGYKETDLANYFAAEQIDAIALALDNIKRGFGFIIGDQTGIGKGRVNAAIIRYARQQGVLPVFVSHKANLYSDMVRDLVDIGVQGFNPFVTNAGLKGKYAIPLPDGRKITTGTTTERAAEMSRIEEDPLGAGYDGVFTTYSQLQSLGSGETRRQQFFRNIAGRSLYILDESHNAGGGQNDRAAMERNPEKVPRSIVVRDALRESPQGVFYSSATYAKRPDVMGLYFRTDMSLAVDDVDNLSAAIEQGGVPLQQAVAAMLAETGQYVRRERSFAGTTFDSVKAPVDRNMPETAARIMQAVRRFDELKENDAAGIEETLAGEGAGLSADNAVGQSGMHSTRFTSVMHNLIDQFLLAVKAEGAVERAVDAARAGEKPVIAVANTMGSFLDHYAEQNNLVNGDAVDLDFSALFQRYLDRSRELLITEPDGTKYRWYIPDEELSAETLAAYDAAKDLIANSKIKGAPVSPLDYIIQRLEQEGLAVGELTGRGRILAYDKDFKTGTLQGRSKPNVNTVINQFNSGELDALLLNSSASTGLSIHASENFTDQKKRRMIVAQADKDINTFMQILGRVFRTGQVTPPAYELMYGDIPAETRPAAVLSKKMASLNANTTAGRKSDLSQTDVPDFFNEYGDQVVAQIMFDNREIHKRLGEPLGQAGEGEGFEPEDAMRKVTGRIPLLPLKEQEAIYEQIISEYQETIEALEKMGVSTMEAKTMDLRAQTLRTMELTPARGERQDSPFAAPSRISEMDVRKLGRPYNEAQIREHLAESLSMTADASLDDLQAAGRQYTESLAGRLDRQVDAFNREKIAEFDPEDTDKQNRFLTRSNAAADRVRNILRQFPVGGTLEVTVEGSGYEAIVLNIAQRGKTESPAANSDWRMTLALNDASRQVTVPFSKLAVSGSDASTATRSIGVMPNDDRIDNVLQQFEAGRRDPREKRYIVTGNILAGFDAVNREGQIINFTTSDGGKDVGILLPKRVRINDLVRNQDVSFNNTDQIFQFIGPATSEQAIAKTADKQLKIDKVGEDQIRFQTSATRRRGGKYFLNRRLLDAAGEEFVKVGEMMRMTVAEGTARRMLEQLMADGYGFVADNYQPAAKEIVGLDQSEWSEPGQGAGGGAQYTTEPGLDDLTDDQVRAAFERFSPDTVFRDDAGNLVVRKAGRDLKIERADAIEMDAVAFTVAHRRIPRPGEQPTGEYTPGRIRLTRQADRWVLDHESFHWLRDAGFVSSRDYNALRHGAKKAAGSTSVADVTEEDVADFVADQLARRRIDAFGDRLKKALQKIFDIVDGLVNLVRRTARGAVRDIESGRVAAGRPAAAAGATGARYQGEATQGPWYSELSRAVDQMDFQAMPPRDLLNRIKKAGGVKQEELDWTGLEPWLQEQEGKVSKEEVQSYLAANQLEVREVEKGGEADPVRSVSADDWRRYLRRNNFLSEEEIMDFTDQDIYNVVSEDVERGDIKLEDAGTPANAAKFAEYQLPGGENYRELLITLPPTPTSSEKIADEIYGKPLSELSAEHLDRVINETKNRAKNTLSEKYKSPHWNEPNVLAHIRFNERTGPNGERVLFLEEVQSDWHQEGRKGGYTEELPPNWTIAKENGNVGIPASFDNREDAESFLNSQEFKNKFGDKTGWNVVNLPRKSEGAVPDAPFKTTWPMLIIKRMVRYAAENGFDKVAWAPGEVQAERYDLSKQIDTLNYINDEHGNRMITAFKDGQQVITKNNVAPEDLPDIVGKELADKLLKAPEVPPGIRRLQGEEMEVGGEGMKAFYDQILVNKVNKFFGKGKWGKAKVATTKIESREIGGDRLPSGAFGRIRKVWALPITDQMREKAMAEGMPLFAIRQSQYTTRTYRTRKTDEGTGTRQEFNYETGQWEDVAGGGSAAGQETYRRDEDTGQMYRWDYENEEWVALGEKDLADILKDERLRDVPREQTVTYSLFEKITGIPDVRRKYQEVAGDRLWRFFSEGAPEAVGRRIELIDKINRGTITDYRKDPEWIRLREVTDQKIRQAREKAKELARIIAAFPRAEQIRIGQVIEGSVTVTPKRYEAALQTAEEFKRLEAELQDLGILGQDNRFRQLTRRELAEKWREIGQIEADIAQMEAKLHPTTKVEKKRSKRISEAVTEKIATEVVSGVEGGGGIETEIKKSVQLNEDRVREALTNRGFARGEADQMIERIKQSAVASETAPETQSATEIRKTIERTIERTVSEQITKTRTYSRSMMARARGSIIKDINKKNKERAEILSRIQTHYKMSGKKYLRLAYDTIEDNQNMLHRFRRAVKQKRLQKGYDIRRKDLDAKWRWEHRLSTPKLVLKGISAEAHDAELMRMFVKVARNEKWAMDAKDWAEAKEENQDLANWKPMPTSTRLGPLAGMMVDPYIYDDLNQTIEQRSEVMKFYDELLRLWKTGKVVYNPASQARNIMSGFILSDMGDLPIWRVDVYARAAAELKRRGEIYRTAYDQGILGVEWAGHEIKTFLDEAENLRSKDGNMYQQGVRLIKKLADAPGKSYQSIEQFFKLALFIHQREKGHAIPDAAAHAEKWGFNYAKIPPAIRWAKRWYSPFITFTYKAMPRAAEVMVRKPWKMAKYVMLMYAVEEMSRRLLGESEDEAERERKVLPDYMRRYTLPGIPSHLRVPLTDKYGRSKYLDLSYILPWGDIGEMWGQSRISYVPRAFLPSHPGYLTLAEIGFDEVMFTGQPLSREWHTKTDYAKEIGKEVWRQAMPLLAGSYSWNKLMSAAYGGKDWAGRDRSLGEAVFDVFFGIKLRSIDYSQQLEWRMREQQDAVYQLRRDFARDYRHVHMQAPSEDLEHQRVREQKLYEKYNDRAQRILDNVTKLAE